MVKYSGQHQPDLSTSNVSYYCAMLSLESQECPVPRKCHGANLCCASPDSAMCLDVSLTPSREVDFQRTISGLMTYSFQLPSCPGVPASFIWERTVLGKGENTQRFSTKQDWSTEPHVSLCPASLHSSATFGSAPICPHFNNLVPKSR